MKGTLPWILVLILLAGGGLLFFAHSPQGAELARLQAQQTSQTAACINNLRQIDAAKLQWALENNRPTGSAVGPQDLAAYFSTKAFPSCPAGGVYSVNAIGQSPACTIPGHILPK